MGRWLGGSGRRYIGISRGEGYSASGGGGSSAPDVVAATAAGLGAATAGKTGAIAIGTYPDIHYEDFRADGTRWIGLREYTMLTQTDAWGMDLSNRSLASFRNAYVRFYSGLPYGKAHTFLSAGYTAGNATMNVNNTTDFAASGVVRMRDQLVNYTGKTANTFTGCSGGAGTFPTDVTPITQGEVGGWGTQVKPMDRAGDLWTAGARLQERVNCYLNGGADLTALTVATYYWNYNVNDDVTPPPDAPSGGLGLSVAVTGPADPKAGSRAAERNFSFKEASWTDWTATAPSKRYLHGALYGKMPAGANDNGEVYGYTLRLRWVI